jgi:hypothetical protein
VPVASVVDQRLHQEASYAVASPLLDDADGDLGYLGSDEAVAPMFGGEVSPPGGSKRLLLVSAITP